VSIQTEIATFEDWRFVLKHLQSVWPELISETLSRLMRGGVCAMTERRTEPITEPTTQLGGLSQCMVDGDREGLVRARRLRGKALAVSIAVQVVFVAALLIGPLIAVPGALPPSYIFTPLPPYHGGGSAERPRPRVRAPERQFQQILANHLFFHSTELRRPAHDLSGEPAPDVPPAIGDFGPGNGAGPPGVWIQGGSDDGLRIQPPPPTVSRKPVLKSEGVMAGALIYRVDPLYPQIARAMHLSGTVRLRAIISTDGSIQSLEVLSGSPILARAAVAAVRQWRYRPTLLNDRPVEVETYVTVNFVLGN
jgi:periplasmic protein TonB